MKARVVQAAKPWSHEGLERRGYRKCPLCWRHLVKLEEHVAAHEAGLIGPDGKRTDRSDVEKRRWAERYDGRASTLSRRRPDRSTLVPTSRLHRLFELPSTDIRKLRRELDAVSDPRP